MPCGRTGVPQSGIRAVPLCGYAGLRAPHERGDQLRQGAVLRLRAVQRDRRGQGARARHDRDAGAGRPDARLRRGRAAAVHRAAVADRRFGRRREGQAGLRIQHGRRRLRPASDRSGAGARARRGRPSAEHLRPPRAAERRLVRRHRRAQPCGRQRRGARLAAHQSRVRAEIRALRAGSARRLRRRDHGSRDPLGRQPRDRVGRPVPHRHGHHRKRAAPPHPLERRGGNAGLCRAQGSDPVLRNVQPRARFLLLYLCPGQAALHEHAGQHDRGVPRLRGRSDAAPVRAPGHGKELPAAAAVARKGISAFARAEKR